MTAHNSDDLNPDAHAPTPSDIETLELFRRTPQPYLRHKDELRPPSPLRVSVSTRRRSARTTSHRTISDADGRKRRKLSSQSPSESGTEADDEGYTFVKALPAPPLRPHKGLRDGGGEGSGTAASPLLTPTQIDDEARKFSDGYFDGRAERRGAKEVFTDEETRLAKQKYRKRRRNELLRRTTETALMAGIGALAVGGCGCWKELVYWHRELGTHVAVIVGGLCLYPLRLLYHSWRRAPPSKSRLRRLIHVPAAFDPATILYPPTLPVLISISLFDASPKSLLPNILLGLAALPPRIIPLGKPEFGYSNLHWLVSILPLFAAENTDVPSKIRASKPYKLKLPPPDAGLDPELLVTLFALHQALLPPLYYLTTTSLLPAELHILSIGLINLLLFSDSPQANILKTLMWLGGVGLFVLCSKVLKWGVELARIPRWRLRRAGQLVGARQSFLRILNESLLAKKKVTTTSSADSDADEDEPFFQNPLQKTKSLKLSILDSVRNNPFLSSANEPHSAVETRRTGIELPDSKANGSAEHRTKRRNTLPILAADDHVSKHRYANRKRSQSIAQSYLSLTPAQATARKWAYAVYFYVVVVAVILGPIRYAIGTYALHGQEPFGWAIGYLFGNLPRLRWEVFNWDLEHWIALPPLLDPPTTTLPPAEHIRQHLGAATTRLMLSSYCLLTILLGLASVLSLTLVEVDTRRKVFHGTMVAMLLPTIFVDPCFVALALALVLAIFLLLDLVRASQLPPLSKPIARFLTPYVDGRDLRGPVVVSHIFLLVGCAIPLWLSLAGVRRAGAPPWAGWEVAARDVSMVAGVVCVGMGDAAASLIGRRYGRRKWPWAGGKSLEGSAAFAGAVVAGLVGGKAWLAVGWGDGVAVLRQGVGMEVLRRCAVVLGKAGVCALGASLNEAVLTGGNDNVVVPVVLWVLVRGVRL